jgi:NADH:ubiquinone oxidoreductase subunit K
MMMTIRLFFNIFSGITSTILNYRSLKFLFTESIGDAALFYFRVAVSTYSERFFYYASLRYTTPTYCNLYAVNDGIVGMLVYDKEVFRNCHISTDLSYLLYSCICILIVFGFVLFVLPSKISNNIIKIFISTELIFLAIQGLLIYFSLVIGDINGLVFYVLLFGIMTAETIIGICVINLKYLNTRYFNRGDSKKHITDFSFKLKRFPLDKCKNLFFITGKRSTTKIHVSNTE